MLHLVHFFPRRPSVSMIGKIGNLLHLHLHFTIGTGLCYCSPFLFPEKRNRCNNKELVYVSAGATADGCHLATSSLVWACLQVPFLVPGWNYNHSHNVIIPIMFKHKHIYRYHHYLIIFIRSNFLMFFLFTVEQRKKNCITPTHRATNMVQLFRLAAIPLKT